MLLPCFVGLAVLFGAAWWGRTGLMRLLGVALALSAVSILVYTGAEVMVLRSRPLWHTVFLPVNFALTAWLGALGAMFLVARWLPGGLKALPVDMLRQLSLSAVVLMALGAGAWAVLGLLGVDPSFEAALRLFREFPIWRISLAGAVATGFCIVGLLQKPARAGHAAGLGRAGADHAGGGLDLPLGGVHERAGRAEVWRRPVPVRHALGQRRAAGHGGRAGLCVALVAAVTYALDLFPARDRGVSA